MIPYIVCFLILAFIVFFYTSLKRKAKKAAGKSTHVIFFDANKNYEEVDFPFLLIQDIAGLMRISKRYPKIKFQVFHHNVPMLTAPWETQKMIYFLAIWKQIVDGGWKFHKAEYSCWMRDGICCTTDNLIEYYA